MMSQGMIRDDDEDADESTLDESGVIINSNHFGIFQTNKKLIFSDMDCLSIWLNNFNNNLTTYRMVCV